MCDGVPTYQLGGPDGPVLYRLYDGGSTHWYVGPSDRLNDCDGNYGNYLYSGLNPGRPGGAPTAPGYSAGDGWTDYDIYPEARGTITVTAGDGSAIGGGGGH